MIGCGDAPDIHLVGADIDICAVGGQRPDKRVDAATDGVPRAIIGGDVIGGQIAVEVGERAARIEHAVAVGRQRVNAASEIAVVIDCLAWGAGQEVADQQVIGLGASGTVLEAAADIEGRPDHLQRIHLQADGWASATGRIAERRPSRAIEHREIVGVRVAAGVLEIAAGIDLAAVVGDRQHRSAAERRCTQRAPRGTIPLGDAIGVGVAAGIGEAATGVKHRAESVQC